MLNFASQYLEMKILQMLTLYKIIVKSILCEIFYGDWHDNCMCAWIKTQDKNEYLILPSSHVSKQFF